MAGALELVTDLAAPHGLITVDLVDDHSGRVIQREQAENFLSLQTIKVAKWWQRMMWGAFNPVETTDALGQKPTEMPWFPAQHIAYWNDGSAEDAANEDRIAKEIVGWASRHPVGSPSGKRGVVNISESEFKDASSKWVFDWTTSQGNGTFQSVGWSRIDEASGFPICRFPEDDGITFTNAGVNPSGGTDLGNALYWDAGADLWYLTEVVTAGSTIRVASASAAGGSTSPVFSFPGTSWADQSGTNPFGWIKGLARLGTDFVSCGRYYQSGTGYFPKVMRHTSGGTASWARNETTVATGTHYNDITVDGSSNIWTAGSDGVMRRHNSADGTISASVTPAVGPTVLEGIAYDSGDSNFWVLGTVGGVTKQLWKVDGSGNTVGPLYSGRYSALSVTSSSPYTGTYVVPNAGSREPYLIQPWYANTNTQAGSYIYRLPTRASTGSNANFSMYANGTPTNVNVKGDLPWVGSRSYQTGGLGGASWTAPVRGGTLGTRAKLSSAVTKTSSQTLKITYQFNFS